MEAGTYAALFWDALESVSQSYPIKYSKRAFCVYQKLGDVFWSAQFFCGSFLEDGQLKVTVSSGVKHCAFDAMQFSVIEPGKKRRITDALWVQASFAAGPLQIDGKTCRFPCASPEAFAARAGAHVRDILDGLLEQRTEFLASVSSKDGGLLSWLAERWEEMPLEAGMACLCREDYGGAVRCFELARQRQCIWRKSVGRPGRYLHLVFLDYCKVMQSGVEWTEDLVVNGLAAAQS